MAIDDLKKACDTYVEQTKLLVALASAFLIAPAALLGLIRAEKGTVVVSASQLELLVWAEALWVCSVVCGYVVLGTVAGSQHDGTYNVYRAATRISSLLQLGSYLAGLVLFVLLVVGIVTQGQPSPEAQDLSEILDSRLRCRGIADSYVRENTDARGTVAADRADYSPARNSCIASVFGSSRPGGSTRSVTSVDYKVIDLLSGDVLFAGSCNNSDSKVADFCGNGRGVSLRDERDKAFALALGPSKAK